VVVTQAACEVCAIAYDQVRASLQRTAPDAVLVSLQPQRLTDVLDDIVEVARACGVGERGTAVVRRLTDRLDAVGASALRPPPRVAVVEWLAPLMLAGHWVPDVIERAGATPVGPAAGTPSPYASWDELRALRPDALVVAPCGFDLERTLAESAPVAGQLRSVCDRVLFLDGNVYLNRPGPRLVEAVETIGAWLRGAEPSAERGRAGWSALVTPARTKTA
jgi:iron complex transport system substrate-binding protein